MLKTKCIYRANPQIFDKSKELVDKCIYFCKNERVHPLLHETVVLVLCNIRIVANVIGKIKNYYFIIRVFIMEKNKDEIVIYVKDFLWDIWKSKFIVLIITLVCTISAFVVFQFVFSDSYSASGILIVSNRENINGTEITKSDIEASRSLSATCMEILTTKTF